MVLWVDWSAIEVMVQSLATMVWKHIWTGSPTNVTVMLGVLVVKSLVLFRAMSALTVMGAVVVTGTADRSVLWVAGLMGRVAIGLLAESVTVTKELA